MHAQTPAAPISIRDRFLADHHRLEVLLAELLAAIDATDREATARLWIEFDAALLGHLEVEETHMIPVLLRASERDARVLIQEHRHIRRRLTELGDAIRSNLVRLEAVRDFLDELRAHTQSEDRLLYKEAATQLDETQRTSALDAISADGLSDNPKG